MNNHAELSQYIVTNIRKLSQEIVTKQHVERNNVAAGFNMGYPDLLEYTQRDLYFLAEAFFSQNSSNYENQAAWLKSVFQNHGVPDFVLSQNLQMTRQVLLTNCPREFAPLVESYFDKTAAAISQPNVPQETLIDSSNPQFMLAWRFLKTLLAGDRQLAGQMILSAVREGVSIQDIYMRVIQPCLYEVGRLWQINQINVAQEHYFSAAVQMIMSQLYPSFLNSKKNGRTTIACCVPGELHEIGLRMVSDLMEAKGWESHYLGADTPLSSIIELIKEKKADVVMLSASVPPYVSALRPIIKSIRREMAGKVKIMAGGFFFSLDSSFSKSIEADGFAANAVEAVAVAGNLVGIAE